MAITRPTLFLGRRDAAKVLKADVADQSDDGQTFTALLTTNAYYPAGAGGEAVFRGCFVPLITDTGNFSFTVTPILDGVRHEATTIAVAAVTERYEERYEIAFSQPHSSGGAERARVGLRGARIQVEIATTTTKHVIFGEVEVVYQVVRESRRAGVA